MAQPLTGDNRDLIDLPISGLHITGKGRRALADGDIALAVPGFDPVLALDLLFAVACWEDRCAAADHSS